MCLLKNVLKTKPEAKPDPIIENNEDWLFKAVEIIKKWEGFRSKAYKDPVGIWTIGYGTIKYPNGIAVKRGDKITEALATSYLLDHVEDHIVKPMAPLIKVALNENQYAALVSFTYNLGIGNLRRSTLLKKLNQGDFEGAANEFMKWVKAGGKTLQGLVNRRREEKALFETPAKVLIRA